LDKANLMNLSTSSFKDIFVKILLPTIIAFSAICVSVDYLVTDKVLSLDLESGTSKFYHLFHKADSKTVPIFGSSRARCSFVSDKLGSNVYNYGCDGASIDQHLFFADYIVKKQKPNYVIINLDYLTWAKVGDYDAYVPFLWDNDIYNFVLNSSEKDKFQSWHMIPGLRYFNYYDNIAKDFLNYKLKMSSSTKQGFTDYFSRVPNDSAKFFNLVRIFNSPELKANFKFTESDRMRYTNLFKKYPEQKFIVVVAPYYSGLIKDISKIRSLSSELDFLKQPNVTLLDYTSNNYPWQYFDDARHLNMKGAKIFTDSLCKDIKKLGINL